VTRVLLLSTTTGYQLRSFGEAATRLGIELLLATDRCQHLDDPWRDGAVPVRFYDDERSLRAIVDAARDRPVHGVLAVGDRPTVLAAKAARALGLRGNPVEAADATRSKKMMRRLFGASGMRVPWTFELQAGDDIPEAALRAAYPCVIKPVGLSGSRGVMRVDNPEEFLAAVERIRELLWRPTLRAQRTALLDEILAEGYIDGREFAVEGVLTNGSLRVFTIFEKPDPLEGPFFEESIYLTPPRIPDPTADAIETEVQRACSALGLRHGPIHAECRVSPRGVVMLEVAARPIGGLCSRVLRFVDEGSDTFLEEVLLRHAVGQDISSCTLHPSAAGVMMIPIPQRGIYRGVTGESAARDVRHIEHLEITAKKEQLIEPLPEGDSYLGFIFARASTEGAVEHALREAHRQLRFEIDRELTVRAVV
jgi:hypothetical protein